MGVQLAIHTSALVLFYGLHFNRKFLNISLMNQVYCFSDNLSKEKVAFLYTKRKAPSCNLLIRLYKDRLRNIHKTRQYPNCDQKKVFMINLNLFVEIDFI